MKNSVQGIGLCRASPSSTGADDEEEEEEEEVSG